MKRRDELHPSLPADLVQHCALELEQGERHAECDEHVGARTDHPNGEGPIQLDPLGEGIHMADAEHRGIRPHGRSPRHSRALPPASTPRPLGTREHLQRQFATEMICGGLTSYSIGAGVPLRAGFTGRGARTSVAHATTGRIV